MPTRLLIFDDGRGRFGPLTDLRAVFELRSGAVSTLLRIERVTGRRCDALWAPPRLAEVLAERRGVQVNRLDEVGDGDWLLINGRWLGLLHADRVINLPRGCALLQHDGQLVAAHVPAGAARPIIDAGFTAPTGLPTQRLPAPPPADPFDPPRDGHGRELTLIERPWHLLDQLACTLPADLLALDLPAIPSPARQGEGFSNAGSPESPHPAGWGLSTNGPHPAGWGFSHVIAFGSHPIKIAPDARIQPMVVLNAENGPIVIDAGAEIQPFAVLTGPCYVGRGSTIACHAHLRPHSVIGPSCKVGGEVSYSILHGYSNKAHLGYLGHSLVGQWCNLGGDTNVSNLKNTYGSIRVQLSSDPPEQPAEDTGRTFLGPILGDFTLTAIGTRILCGSCIATGTMLALSTFAPKVTSRFSFHTDAGVEPYEIERFLDMARRMTTRRCCGLSSAEERLLRALHEQPAGFVPAAR